MENSDAASRPSRIEVTTRSGATFFVYQPVVVSDSLKGFSDPDRKSPTAMPTSEIASAQTRQLSGGRTALLVLGVVALTFGTLIVLAAIAFSEATY